VIIKCIFYIASMAKKLVNTQKTEIKKYTFKNGFPVEFEIVSLTTLYENNKAALIVPHRTSFYHILLFKDNVTSHNVDFKSLKINSGTLVFLNKDVVQQFSNTPAKGTAILFSEDFFARTDKDLQILKSSVLFNDLFEIATIDTTTADPSILQLFKALETEANKSFDGFQSDILHNYLSNLLLYSEREYRRTSFKQVAKSDELDFTLLFKDLVETHFRANRQVSFFIKKMNITEKRLNKATTKILGKTPKTVIDERVILECKRLLSYSSQSAKEIGYQLGFDEPTNFIKYFKKHTAITPFDFRNNFYK